jgi:cbb3-type cytochrome oxidase subunit 1
MDLPRVIPRDDGGSRRIRRSRIASYVLVLVAAAVLSCTPRVFGDPSSEPLYALLHVWRVVVGIALVVAALAVQVIVGVRWRAGLRDDAGGGPSSTA